MIKFMYSWFKPTEQNEIRSEAWATTFAKVLLELLPMLTPSQGMLLLGSGIAYLDKLPGMLHDPALTLLRENLNSIDILCASTVVPDIVPQLFQEHAQSIKAWMITSFSDDIPLLECFLKAFENL
ncbi:MAG: hypothetical protein ACOYKA_06780 [Legionellaceae bacterium]